MELESAIEPSRIVCHILVREVMDVKRHRADAAR